MDLRYTAEEQQFRAELREWLGDRIRVFSGLEHRQMPEFYSAVAMSGGAIVSTSIAESFQLTLLEAA